MDSGRYASQQELADELGCSQAWISRVLNGKE
jgi:biotin operon repressor